VKEPQHHRAPGDRDLQPPEDRPRDPFTNAADMIAGRRAQLEARLTTEQRRTYENACRKAEQAIEAKDKDLAARKQGDIQDRMRKLLLTEPQLRLNVPGRRETINEVLAKRLAAQQVMGPSPAQGIPAYLWRQTENRAVREIEREHGQEKQNIRAQNRKDLDKILERFDRARQSPQDHRPGFARAASGRNARAEFEKAARDDPAAESRKPQHSEALKQALERARAEEEARHSHEKDHGRTRK